MANPNWVKGVSGNPQGRRVEHNYKPLLARFRRDSDEVYDILMKLIRDEHTPSAVRGHLLKYHIDRTEGKIAQAIKIEAPMMDIGLKNLSTAQLELLASNHAEELIVSFIQDGKLDALLNAHGIGNQKVLNPPKSRTDKGGDMDNAKEGEIIPHE